ncbi:uncharacterized protein LOC107043491 [Diachasma alloeum]|uniref:uncharacterized protein LOC107043491 n=1 Tax=Diachasma alloeum TaxID=454923 RepID=UPI0007383FCD|nr:uncharacterized protein LOC107043491 [Diachasma alloeum]
MGEEADTTQALGCLIVRPASFSTERPELWFAQLEGQFHLAGIVDELDKFHMAAVHLDTVVGAEVQDVILHSPAQTPYKMLKDASVERLNASQEASLHQLLDKEVLGDCKPSQFLHLKSLVDIVLENILITKWLSRLPRNTQSILATQANSTLNKMAALADKLQEISSPPTITAISAAGDPAVAVLEQRFSRLKACISELAGAVRNQRFHSHSRPKSRSRTSIQKIGQMLVPLQI